MTEGEHVPAPVMGSAQPTAERRRSTVARFRFDPDPRRLRALLDQVDACLESRDSLERHQVQMLVGEIVSRQLDYRPFAPVYLDLELKENSVRIDIAQLDGGDGFWDALDTSVFSDLTTAWGQDRRGSGGAWFEVGSVEP